MLPTSHQEGEHAKEAGQDVPAASQAEEATHRLGILSGFSNIPPLYFLMPTNNALIACTMCLGYMCVHLVQEGALSEE